MDGSVPLEARSADGRWLPGQSGNPGGKKLGTRNRASLLAEALEEGEAEAILRVVVAKALAGDGVAARFCVSRLFPKPRGRAIHLDLPAGTAPGDIVAAFDATLAAMAAGEITPEEALTVARVLEARRKAVEAQHDAQHRHAPAEAPAALHSACIFEEPSLANIAQEPSPACSQRSEASPVAAAEAYGFRGSGRGRGEGELDTSKDAGARVDLVDLDPAARASEVAKDQGAALPPHPPAYGGPLPLSAGERDRRAAAQRSLHFACIDRLAHAA